MHIVVNHLRLRDPLPQATAAKLQEAVDGVVAAGALAAQVAKVDERHLVLILRFASPQDADRISRDVGGPWMREHIVPLLAGGTERSVGEAIAAADS